MRFISEFESCDDGANYHYNESIANRELGEAIAKAFNWTKSKNEFNNTLEIEAFPMEKWIEFKANILNISDLDSIQYKTLIDLISELESFGKPAADTITNQKLTNDRTE